MAGRLFWMFEYLGCPNVRILDGGWDKWIADGNQPETIVNTRKAAKFEAIVNPDIAVDKEHIADRMNDTDFAVIDTRTDAEFIGWTLYNEERGGHITGYASTVGFFGHAVGETNDDLKALIAATPAFHGPGFLLPTRNAALFRWCLDNGLRVTQPMTLMSKGPYHPPTSPFLPSITY